MLAELYPRMHRRFVSLPVFGPVMDAFVEWLVGRGYSGDRVREYCRAVRRLDRQLARRGVPAADADPTTASSLCAD